MGISDFNSFEEVYIELNGYLIKSTVVSSGNDILVTLCTTFGDIPDSVKMLPYCFFNANLVCLNKSGAVLLKKDSVTDCYFEVQQLNQGFSNHMRQLDKDIEEAYNLTIRGLRELPSNYKYGNIRIDGIREQYTSIHKEMEFILNELSERFKKDLTALKERADNIGSK